MYINFKNYNYKSLESNKNIFLGISYNVILCINNINNLLDKDSILLELDNLQCPILDCTNNWDKNKNKIIYDNGNCIDNCQKDKIYKYEYEYTCYKECPFGTHSTKENKYLCKKDIDKCLNKKPFININV